MHIDRREREKQNRKIEKEEEKEKKRVTEKIRKIIGKKVWNLERSASENITPIYTTQYNTMEYGEEKKMKKKGGYIYKSEEEQQHE